MATAQEPPGMTEPPPWDEPGEQPTPAPPNLAPVSPAPHDEAAERYVLGAAMLNPDQITECARLLTSSDFWKPAHETIWRSLLALHSNGHPTGPDAVAAHLLDSGKQTYRSTLGDKGPLLLFELTAACQMPEQATYFADRVEKLSRRRSAIAALRQNLQRLESPGADDDVDHALNTVATKMAEARDSLANLPAPTTWSPVDLAPVFAGDYLDPPPTMLERTDGVCLFYDTAVHVIAGESESGKTWLALLATVQLIQQAQRVVFIDFEDRADRVIARLLGLGAHPDQIRAHFAYIRPDRPLDDDGRHQLSPAITGSRLVIIDGVTEAMTMHGYDLNSNADAALYLALLPRWIADHGPAVAMIDHVVKDQEKQGRFAVGAQHKLAGIDGVQYIVKMLQPFARGKRGLARIDIGKDRPGHVRGEAHGKVIAEFTLDASENAEILIAHLMPPGTDSGRQGDHFEPTGIMEKVSRLVQQTPHLSRSAIENMVNGKATTIRTAIELLTTRGYIGTTRGPKNAIQHVHIRSYYADQTIDQELGEDEEPRVPGNPWDEPNYTPEEPPEVEDEPDTELDIPDPADPTGNPPEPDTGDTP